MIVKRTIAYAAADKNSLNVQVSFKQTHTFPDILLLSGCVPMPRRRIFWREKEDTLVTLVTKRT